LFETRKIILGYPHGRKIGKYWFVDMSINKEAG
jgi:hypothetical protein